MIPLKEAILYLLTTYEIKSTTEPRSRSFTGNMWNLNQMSPLNKMIPLAEVLGGGGGGGCMGGYRSPWTTILSCELYIQ